MTLQAPQLPARPKRARVPRKTLPVPQPAPGETMVVGLGDWAAYLETDRRLGTAAFRVRYLRGILELMSVSRLHEEIKVSLGKFVETFCEENDLDYRGWGNATQKLEGESAGEPDQSYIFGIETKERPDLVIEVALSSGGIAKLDFWATLQIPEVWIWRKQALKAYVFDGTGYSPVVASRCLPGIDFAVMQEFTLVQPTSKAVREFRARMGHRAL